MSRWQTILAIDSDRWACETYRANFPDVAVKCGPVADYLDALPDSDVILGGPPCQPFSDAGENEGETDERDCFPDYCAAVERKRPRMFLAENVRGLLKEKHLPYFGRVLQRLEDAGYVVEWRLLDAVSFGVPQFRERVWVWGIRRDLYAAGVRHRWPLPTHAWPPPDECMFGAALLPGVTVGQALGLDGYMETGSKCRRDHNGVPRGPLVDTTNRPSFTVDSRPPDVRAVAVIGGKRGGGNSHAMPQRDMTDEPAQTLMHHQRQGNHALAVVEYRWSDAMLTKHPPASPASPAPTVQAKWFKGGAEGLIDVTGIRRLAGPGSQQEKYGHTYTPAEPCPTIGGFDGGGSGLAFVKGRAQVRRLTPVECLRLQSGPDDFAWPDKITKTAMYRVVGNGWACRMGAVFSEAFALADPDSRTVIDLFCGGGLGACGWHGRAWTYAAALSPTGRGRAEA